MEEKGKVNLLLETFKLYIDQYMYLVSMENVFCILGWGQKVSELVLCVSSSNPVAFNTLTTDQSIFISVCLPRIPVSPGSP